MIRIGERHGAGVGVRRRHGKAVDGRRAMTAVRPLLHFLFKPLARASNDAVESSESLWLTDDLNIFADGAQSNKFRSMINHQRDHRDAHGMLTRP
jgi:hypothetical protein